MMIARRARSLVAPFLACLLFLSVGDSFATSYVMPTDAQLVAKSPLIVRAVAADAAAGPDRARPVTDTTFEVSEVFKGFLPASTIVVRSPGGRTSDGRYYKVYGAARFSVGGESLLFLTPNDDGTYAVVDLALGAFHRRTTPGSDSDIVLRDLSESHSLAASSTGVARDLDGFVAWLRDPAGAPEAMASYRRALPSATAPFLDPDFFNITVSPEGFPPDGCDTNAGNAVRWEEFDRGLTVPFLAFEGGQPGIPGGGFNEIATAMAAWNSVSSSRVDLAFAGTTTRTIAIGGTDEVNSISFEDPNDQIPGNFSGAGIVAIATVFFDCFTVRSFLNGTAHPLLEAGIVTQNGTGSFYLGNANNPVQAFIELMTHELGHTVGLAHSCGDPSVEACTSGTPPNNAIMRAILHNDGRGADLNSDDRAGIRFLYPLIVGQVPNAPSNLTVTAGSTSTLELGWSDNSFDETLFEIEERELGGNFTLVATATPGTTTATISGLGETTAREYRVRARSEVGFSDYSNVAGATTNATVTPCVADSSTLCLTDGRFRVFADWETAPTPSEPEGTSGAGVAASISSDTGTFWFFDPANIELVVKVLDACFPPFDSFWVFAGGLTDTKVTLTVVDTSDGRARTYFNPLQTAFRPVQDTSAFTPCEP